MSAELARARALALAAALLLLAWGCGGQYGGVEVEKVSLSNDGDTAVIRLAETRPGSLRKAVSGTSRVYLVHAETGIKVSCPLGRFAREGILLPNHGRLFRKGDKVFVEVGKFSSRAVFIE